jgi:hypothetical protein
MNPYKNFKMSMQQIAESIRPKEQNFLTKEQLDELYKRTYDGTQEPKGEVVKPSCIVEVIEEEGDIKEDLDDLTELIDNINFE